MPVAFFSTALRTTSVSAIEYVTERSKLAPLVGTVKEDGPTSRRPGLRPVGSHVDGLEEDDGALVQVAAIADPERRQDRGDALRRQHCRSGPIGGPEVSGVVRGRVRQDQVERGVPLLGGAALDGPAVTAPARTPATSSRPQARLRRCVCRVSWCLRPRYMTGSPLSAGAGPPRVRQRNRLCRQPRSAVYQPQRRGSEQPPEDMLRFSTWHVNDDGPGRVALAPVRHRP